MRNALLTNTMLAMLSIAPLQVMAQETSTQEAPAQEAPAQEEPAQAEPAQEAETEVLVTQEPAMPEVPAEIVLAYEEYAAARLTYSQAQAEAGDVEAAANAALVARENLTNICANYDAPNLSACLDQFIAPEMRVANDLDPIIIEVAPVEAAPEAVVEATEDVLETEELPEAEVAPEVEAAPEVQVEEQPAAEATQEEVTEAPAQDAPVPAEQPAQEGEAEVSTDVQVEEEAPVSEMDAEGTEAPVEAETASEQAVEPINEATEPLEPAENTQEAETIPEDVAPVLDSAKEAPPASADGEGEMTIEAETSASSETEVKDDAKAEETADAPPPKDDAEAQKTATPKEVTSITAEEGERVSESDQAGAVVTRGAPANAEVVEQSTSDFRVVFQFNNQVIVENQDNTRLEQDSSETYVERLSNGRIRETILRADGTEIVTIYNRNGDIIRRSRFTADGEEYVLVYVDESYEQDLLEWRDPALDLGPLQLDIPVSEYVLDADDANEDELVQFLDQPPVENVQRLYSVNEVKRSARIRDMVRRLEIGGLTFETGKATIPTDQIASLANVADAMLDMLAENPAETFLIEGHTDAVGGEIYNLALSDRRAETVAVILSRAFGVPPENLATQGYGERYLKVRTQEADRRNRRVTIKRITPLISPVARR